MSAFVSHFLYQFIYVLVLSELLVQEGVAIEIAEAVVGALSGELAATAVNAPMVPAEVNPQNICWL